MKKLTAKHAIKKDVYEAGDILIVDIESLGTKYQEPKYQLFVTNGGGFGCDVKNMGNAIFGHWWTDNLDDRIERYNVLGVIKSDIFHKVLKGLIDENL